MSRGSRANTVDRCIVCERVRPCEMQHFPRPKHAGGVTTVPFCVSCHDATDRMPLDTWDVDELTAGWRDLWTKLDTEGRLLFVKFTMLIAMADTVTGNNRRKEQ